MNIPEVFVVSAARTAIGTFGGALKDVPPADLATTAVYLRVVETDLSAIEASVDDLYAALL